MTAAEDVSHAIMNDDLFWDRFRRARRRVLGARDRDDCLREEVSQEALLSLHRYFRRARLADRAGWADDEFGGWLYAACRRHLKWAFHRWLRQARERERSIDTVDQAASGEPPGLHEGAYRGACDVVAAALGRFPEPLKSVMDDFLSGAPRHAPAERLGLSENWVSQLRAKGIEVLVQALREHLACVLP